MHFTASKFSDTLFKTVIMIWPFDGARHWRDLHSRLRQMPDVRLRCEFLIIIIREWADENFEK